jgi:hypothetical protein
VGIDGRLRRLEGGSRPCLTCGIDPLANPSTKCSSYEPRDVMRAGHWSKEIEEPSWKALDRASVEALIGQPLGN